MDLADAIQTIPCKRCDGEGTEAVIDGQKLRTAREQAGVSMGQMSRALGISVTHVSDLERGNRAFSEDLARRFLAVLKT